MNNLAKELHKPVVRKFERRKVKVYEVNEIWAADLVDMRLYEKENDGYKYSLNVIDCFSKFVWIEPLKTKSGENVLNAFNIILGKSGKIPNFLWVDKGSEFYNKRFMKMLETKQIKMYSVFNENKSAIIERFNRTIKEKMFEFFTATGKYRWIREIASLVRKYNNTYHSTIKMTPKEATSKTKHDAVFENINRMRDARDIKVKFEVGDKVRIALSKAKFEKGYTQNWSNEIFTVSKIVLDQPIVYQIKDIDGEVIDGSFYSQELLKTAIDTFFIEKVIQSKTIKGVKMSLVKWKGYAKPSWIASMHVRDVAKK